MVSFRVPNLIKRLENVTNMTSRICSIFHAHGHLSDFLASFLVILPLFCVWKVDSKHRIFKGLNFGIF